MARSPARAPQPTRSPRNPRFLKSRWVKNELRIGNAVVGRVKQVSLGWEARVISLFPGQKTKRIVFRSAFGGSDFAKRRARAFVKSAIDGDLARRPIRREPIGGGLLSPTGIIGLGIGSALALGALGTVTS